MTLIHRTWKRLRHPGIFSLLLIGVLSGLAISAAIPSLLTAQQQGGPPANGRNWDRLPERQISRMVSRLLLRDHLSNMPLDEKMSHRAFDSFLKNLDPLKVFFLQSDYDELVQKRDTIHEQIRSGNTEFAQTVFNRFQKRVDERVATVEKLLAEHEFDFSQEESFVTDGEALKYPQNEAEAVDRWRKRLKYDLLTQKADDKTEEEARERINKRYRSFAKRMGQTSDDEKLEMFLTSFTSSFDPHTTYMSPANLENFYISMRLNLEGIGAALISDDGFCKVSKVIPGGAADKLGKKNPEQKLEPEDVIVSVGQGADGDLVDVVDMRLSDVVDLIRGKADTKVRLGVKKAGKGETRIFDVTRAKVELTDSEAQGEVVEHESPDGTKNKVGWIDLPAFYMDMEGARRGLPDFKSSTRDVARLLSEFKEQNVQSVVLDLRRNGGGSLTEAINLTGLFIHEGPVVQVKDGEGRIQAYDDSDGNMHWSGPLVVLTSKLSASASEILAGAIQDYKRGLVVGDDATHGKGTVQTLLDLGREEMAGANPVNPPKLGALKITLQQFYRPNGESTQQRGVLADVPLPSLTANMDISESDLDYPIPWDRVPSAKFKIYDMVNTDIRAELNRRSDQRRQASEGFQKSLNTIATYLDQKKRKEVDLNYDTFMAEYKALEKDKAEEEALEEPEGDEIVTKDYYFDEVMSVTSDYVQLLRKARLAATQPGTGNRQLGPTEN
ncbi:MAG: carboxy terminal-processing peptidase [Pirellulaceae bacterium]